MTCYLRDEGKGYRISNRRKRCRGQVVDFWNQWTQVHKEGQVISAVTLEIQSKMCSRRTYFYICNFHSTWIWRTYISIGFWLKIRSENSSHFHPCTTQLLIAISFIWAYLVKMTQHFPRTPENGVTTFCWLSGHLCTQMLPWPGRCMSVGSEYNINRRGNCSLTGCKTKCLRRWAAKKERQYFWR